jgi:hypothetical protein
MLKGFTASDGFMIKFCDQEFGNFHGIYLTFGIGCTGQESGIAGRFET